jgi:hypothetical protein
MPKKTNRTALQCLKKFVLDPIPAHEAFTKTKQRQATASGSTKAKGLHAGDKATGQVWSKEEDKHLREGVQRHGMGNWPEGERTAMIYSNTD